MVKLQCYHSQALCDCSAVLSTISLQFFMRTVSAFNALQRLLH
jgi:hypothetical protein